MGRLSLNKIKHENILWLSADFETTIPPLKSPLYKRNYKNYDELLKNEDFYEKPKVYSWAIGGLKEDILKSETYKQHKWDEKLVKLVDYNEEYMAWVGINIESFLYFCVSCIFDQTRMYFHNLKGFDGHYILGALDSYDFEMVKPREWWKKFQGLDLTDDQIEQYKQHEEDREQYMRFVYDDVFNHDVEKTAEALKRFWAKPVPKEYTMIMNGNSQIYNLVLASNNQDRNGYIVEVDIRDNLLLFPTNVKQMGKDLITHYTGQGMSEAEAEKRFSKQTEEKLKGKGYKVYAPLFESVDDLLDDERELFYLIQDTYIVWKYQQLMDYTFSHVGEIVGKPEIKGFTKWEWKLTIASTAYEEWLRCFGPKLIDYYISKKLITKQIRKNGFVSYKWNNKTYFANVKFYRKLVADIIGNTDWLDMPWDIENNISVHRHLHECYYKGGITGPNEDYRYQITYPVCVADSNSMYPDKMRLDVDVPIGVPSFYDDEKKPFKFYKMIINDDIDNNDGRPFVNCYDPDGSTREWKKHLHRGDIYYLTSIELPYFNEYYTADPNKYTLEVELSFYTAKMSWLKGDFINKWYPLKQWASEHGNIALKTGAKLMINSEYGKDGQNNEVNTKLVIDRELVGAMEENASRFYLPWAIATTSLARMNLIDTIGHNNKYNAYDDTDSHFIHYPASCKTIEQIKAWITKTFPKMKLDPTELGKWDIEDYNLAFLPRRPKQYFAVGQNSKGEYIVKMAFAGINANVDDVTSQEEQEEEREWDKKIVDDLTFEDFIYGKTIDNQTAPKRIFGAGVIIDTGSKSINPAWDYDPITEQTIYKKEQIITLFENSKKKYYNEIKQLSTHIKNNLI